MPTTGRRLFAAEDRKPTPEPAVRPRPSPWWPNWWNRLESSRREGELYARRVLPGSTGAARPPVGRGGHHACARQPEACCSASAQRLTPCATPSGGCDQGDYWTSDPQSRRRRRGRAQRRSDAPAHRRRGVGAPAALARHRAGRARRGGGHADVPRARTVRQRTATCATSGWAWATRPPMRSRARRSCGCTSRARTRRGA